MLVDADAFLNAAKAGDPQRLSLARKTGHAASVFAVVYPEYHEELKLAVKAFDLAVKINNLAERISN